jgi:hypothetical protein
MLFGRNVKNPIKMPDKGVVKWTYYIVPTLQRGNAARDAPASRNARALLDELPRRSVGTIHLS